MCSDKSIEIIFVSVQIEIFSSIASFKISGEQLGGEIEINGDNVTYIGDIPQLGGRATTVESILANKTNNYMQKLKYWTAYELKPHHVRILHANANNIAFTRVNKTNYSVAGKAEDITRLKTQLFPKTNLRSTMIHADSMTDLQSNDVPKNEPSMLSNAQSPPSTSSLLITASEQISMFSVQNFEDRLQQHLHETFHVKMTIERPTVDEKSKGEKSRLHLKVIGQTKDVESALEDVFNLFSLLRTRKFDDKTSKKLFFHSH